MSDERSEDGRRARKGTGRYDAAGRAASNGQRSGIRHSPAGSRPLAGRLTPAVPPRTGSAGRRSADANVPEEVEIEHTHAGPVDPPFGQTPPDLRPVPAPGSDGEYDLDDPNLLLNRELTWLNFNFRVLAQAEVRGRRCSSV